MRRDPPVVPALLLVLLAAIQPSGPAGAATIPDGGPAAVLLEVGGRPYSYFELTPDAPLTFTIRGPVVFNPILRWRFTAPPGVVDAEVEVLLDGRTLWNRVVRARSGETRYPGHPDWRAGRPTRLELHVPSGEHSVELRLARPDSGTLDVNPVVGKPEVMPWRMDWRCEIGAAYDSNIFRYSDADVDDFLDGMRPERYDFDYMDELRIEPSVDISFVREEPGRRETEVRLSSDYRLATVNGEKSFSKLSVRLRERRPRVALLSATYSMIPSYHIRQLWDDDADDGSSYRSCDFRQHSAMAEIGSDRSLPVDLLLRARYDFYGYGQDFVEYDSRAGTFGIVGIVRPVRGLRVDVGYALRLLSARGYDEIGETRGTSDDSDTSYEQDEYSVSVRWDVGEIRGLQTVLRLSGKLRKRYYQTSKSGEDDPYHAGREDTYWTVGGRSSHALTDVLSFEAFYEHRRRAADSDFVDDIGLSKDYTADRVGVRLVAGGGQFLD